MLGGNLSKIHKGLLVVIRTKLSIPQLTTFAHHLYGEGCQGQGYLES